MRKKWPKNCEEKVKLGGKSFRKSRNHEYNLLNMQEVWEICFNASKVGMIGAKYAMRPSGAGYKVSSQNNCHAQSKGENEGK